MNASSGGTGGVGVRDFEDFPESSFIKLSFFIEGLGGFGGGGGELSFLTEGLGGFGGGVDVWKSCICGGGNGTPVNVGVGGFCDKLDCPESFDDDFLFFFPKNDHDLDDDDEDDENDFGSCS